MKKISWLLIVLTAFAFTAIGCGKDETAEDDKTEIEVTDPAKPEDGVTPETPEEPITDVPTTPDTPVSNTDTSASPPNTPEKPAKPSAGKPTTGKPTPAPTPVPTPTPPTTPAPTPPPEPAGLSASEIVAKVTATDKEPETVSFDAETVATLYGVDTSSVKSYCVKGPMMNVKANEIAVFELNDAADAAIFKKACENRAADVATMFEQYLADQYEIAKAPSITVVGNYVFMAISENSASMMKDFKELVK